MRTKQPAHYRNACRSTCHTGHDSCYFRRVEYDERLTVIAEQTTDPEAMYGSQLTENLNEPTRLWYRAYEFLRDNDLAAESGTSRRLRTPNEPLAERLADELRELAGVLDGSHSHQGFIADVLLEGSQVDLLDRPDSSSHHGALEFLATRSRPRYLR